MGCACATQEPVTEYKANTEGTRIQSQDEGTFSYEHISIKIIVKMQAWVRGARLRRSLPDLTSDTPIMLQKQFLRNNIAPGGTTAFKL